MRPAGSFTFEPAFFALALGMGWLWLRSWRVDSKPRPSWRAVAFWLGLALVVGALNSPLETIAVDYLVLFHLFQNVVIGDWAPALLILGLTPAMRGAVARRLGSPFARLTRPHIALPVWLVGWYVIHLGPIYDTAVSSTTLLNLEHLFLIAIGLLFWWPVLVDTPNNVPTLGRIGYVFVAFISSAFLGLALTFAPPIYDHYERLTTRLWGIGAAKDQNLGGVLMSTEQALVFGIAIVWLLLRLLREEEASEERLNEEQRAAALRPR
jgi:cytochrome c oxidase assembly factor CtaG